MTLEELVEHTRHALLRDQADPPLWGDPELVIYLNAAEEQFARRTHCLLDDSSPFTELVTTPGQAVYQLDPRVIHVRELVGETGVVLLDRERRQIGRHRRLAGRPLYFTCDAAYKSLRLYPTPDAAYVLTMDVARLPLTGMADDLDEPEIAAEYHLDLCTWAAYKALMNNDPDGTNTLAAKDLRADWEYAIREAKREAIRLRAGDNPRAIGNWTHKRG